VLLAGVAWVLGILAVVFLPDPPYIPPDFGPGWRALILGLWAGALLVPTLPAALSLAASLRAIRKDAWNRELAGPARARRPGRSSISSRARARSGVAGLGAARLAAAMAGAHLLAVAGVGVTLVALGLTPGEALRPDPPSSVGSGRLLRFGRNVERLLQTGDVATLDRYIDRPQFLARVQELAPEDRPRLRRVRDAVAGDGLARRIVDALRTGARVELTGQTAGHPPVFVTYRAGDRTLRLELSFGRQHYLRIVDVHDDAGPWSERLLAEADRDGAR